MKPMSPVVALAAVVAFACANAPSAVSPQLDTASPKIEAARTDDAQKVITTLETKEGRLRIYADSTFAVVDNAGNLLASNLTESALRDRFPEMHRAYRDGVASRRPIDASVDLPNR